MCSHEEVAGGRTYQAKCDFRKSQVKFVKSSQRIEYSQIQTDEAIIRVGQVMFGANVSTGSLSRL